MIHVSSKKGSTFEPPVVYAPPKSKKMDDVFSPQAAPPPAADQMAYMNKVFVPKAPNVHVDTLSFGQIVLFFAGGLVFSALGVMIALIVSRAMIGKERGFKFAIAGMVTNTVLAFVLIGVAVWFIGF